MRHGSDAENLEESMERNGLGLKRLATMRSGAEHPMLGLAAEILDWSVGCVGLQYILDRRRKR